MTERKDAQRFLEDVTGTHARVYTEAISDMVVAVAMQNKPQLMDVRARFAGIVTETMGAGEVLGATLTLQRAARELATLGKMPENRELFHAIVTGRIPGNGELTNFANVTTQTVLPRITFDEAVEDMVTRTPAVLRRAAGRAASRISQLYSEGRVVAFARSAEFAVTSRVQSLIVEAIAEGIPEATAGRLIRLGVDEVRVRTAAWSESYARMAFRTNLNTAVTAGKFRQAQDPDIQRVIPAFRFDDVGDSDTRDNHHAADGLIFRVNNLVWNRIAPPLGYNCRCRVSYIGLPELQRMGRMTPSGDIREDRLPSTAHADEGFRHVGRPDLFMVTAA